MATGSRTLDDHEILEELRARQALLDGHFLLTSGRHSDGYIEKFRAFEDPALTRRLGEAMVERHPGSFDTVASPAMGAVVLGFAAALAGGARSIFAERVDGRLRFQRGFELPRGERTLVVEDVVTTGGSLREVVDLVRARGAECVGVAALADRTPGGMADAFADLGVPVHALVRVELANWEPRDCPLCAADVPLVEPKARVGS